MSSETITRNDIVAILNKTIPGQGTDMSAQGVEDFIEDLNLGPSDYVKLSELGDYVIEQGTSGIWTYRKWNSGISECWGNSTGSIPSGWSSSGITINLPFTFLTVTESFVQFRNYQVARGYTTITATNATSVNIQTNADSALTGTFSVGVKGTWK